MIDRKAMENDLHLARLARLEAEAANCDVEELIWELQHVQLGPSAYRVFDCRLRAGSDRRQLRRRLSFPFLLDHIPNQGRGVRTAQIFHRTDAGRRGDVDLGQPIADHVDADKDHAARAQMRSSRSRISRSRAVRSVFAGEPPRTILERRSSAAGTRLTAPANSPSTSRMRLSPCFTAGRNFLNHPLFAEGRREHVVERAEIRGRRG